MTKSLLLSDLIPSETNILLMEQTLKSKGINPIFYGFYNKFYKLKEEELIRNLCAYFDFCTNREEVNIICHSIGCNIGLILAKERASKIKKATFLSPVLERPSLLERYNTSVLSEMPFFDDDIEEVHFSSFPLTKQIEMLTFYKQTRHLAQKSSLEIENLDSLISYSIADPYVSKKGTRYLVQDLDSEVILCTTKHHNLLLSSEGESLAESIHHFEQNEPYLFVPKHQELKEYNQELSKIDSIKVYQKHFRRN